MDTSGRMLHDGVPRVYSKHQHGDIQYSIAGLRFQLAFQLRFHPDFRARWALVLVCQPPGLEGGVSTDSSHSTTRFYLEEWVSFISELECREFG
jgi:hypothetical protein